MMILNDMSYERQIKALHALLSITVQQLGRSWTISEIEANSIILDAVEVDLVEGVLFLRPTTWESLQPKKVKVSFYCGMYRGAPKWRNGFDWHEEPDECGNSGELMVDAEEWDEKCVSHHCEDCGNELYQREGHFELIEEPPAKPEPLEPVTIHEGFGLKKKGNDL